jgi:hypothetical protein
VLSPVEKKDGKKDLGLKVSSSGCSGGAWRMVGGALLLFVEVVRLEASRLVKQRVPLVEMLELDLLPTVTPKDSEEARMALDCFVMEKTPLVKDLPLNPLGKEHPACVLFVQGTPRLARKILPHLNLRMWRNLLMRMMGWVVGSLPSCSFAFGLGLKPTFSFKGFRLGRVMTNPKSKKQTEVTGPGLPLDPLVGIEFCLGFGSSSGLQWLEVTTAVALSGRLIAPTNSEMFEGAEDTLARPFFFPPEGASSCLNMSSATAPSSPCFQGICKMGGRSCAFSSVASRV